MNLYYIPRGCSLADHIALLEANLPHTLIAVDRTKRTSDGRDFLAINPRGFSPTLELDDGTILTENLAILAYIAEKSGTLMPAHGLERWRVLEAVAFMTTELHGNFRPFFLPDASPAEKDRARGKLGKHFAALADQLGERAFLVGNDMTIADAYLFTMLLWAGMHGITVPASLEAYAARIKTRPAVAQALTKEGIA